MWAMKSMLSMRRAAMVAVFLTGVAGCLHSVAAPVFVGQWVSELDGLALTISEDGRFMIQPTDGRAPVYGTWVETKGEMTFRNQIDSPVCPDAPGTYHWRLSSAGKLLFAIINDDCPPRIAHMEQPFEPINLVKLPH